MEKEKKINYVESGSLSTSVDLEKHWDDCTYVGKDFKAGAGIRITKVTPVTEEHLKKNAFLPITDWDAEGWEKENNSPEITNSNVVSSDVEVASSGGVDTSKSLSEYIWEDDCKGKCKHINIYYVKEFIKKLNRWKEIMRTWHVPLPTIELLCSEFDRFKDKLAGKELVE